MSQHDYIISNDTGANVRSDLNNALGAIATINSGATEPSTTYAYQLWMDTSSNVLKIRNSANSAWYTLPISPVANNTVDINGGTIDGITSLSTANGTDVSLAGVSSTKFFWDASAESLGIGTTSPNKQLSIAASTPEFQFQSTDTAVATNDSLGDLTWYSSDASVGSSGIVAKIAAEADFQFDGSGYGPSIRFYTSGTNPVALTERMRIDSSGTMSFHGKIGRVDGTTGGLSISSQSNNRSYIECASTSTAGMNLIVFFNPNGVTGTITTSGTSTSYNTTSDYRLKEDWQPMSDSIDRLKALNPVNFAWKADGSRVDGFLAHEAAEVVPEAVTGEKDAMRTEEYEVTPAVLDDDGNVVTEAVMGTREVPDYQGIDQAKLVPLLTAALQEAVSKIEALETRIAALEV